MQILILDQIYECHTFPSWETMKWINNLQYCNLLINPKAVGLETFYFESIRGYLRCWIWSSTELQINMICNYIFLIQYVLPWFHCFTYIPLNFLDFFFLFLFFVVLGTKPRALSMLGKYSIIDLYPQPFIVLWLPRFYNGNIAN